LAFLRERKGLQDGFLQALAMLNLRFRYARRTRSQPAKLVLSCLENQGFEPLWAGFLPDSWQHRLKINLLKKQIKFVCLFLICDIQ